MGQKVHPRGFRLGIIERWDSRWYASHDYAKLLHEDLKLREFIKKRLYHAGISRIEIERMANKAKINIYTARPGIVIGKKGAEIDKLKLDIQKLMKGRDSFINIHEVRPRSRSAAGRREYRASARTPRCLPPRDERSGHARDADGRAGRQGPRGGTPRRCGNRSPGMVSRGPSAAADAARRRGLRLCRSAHDLRPNRRESLDFPRRSFDSQRRRRETRRNACAGELTK